jgi:hypothetical protein
MEHKRGAQQRPDCVPQSTTAEDERPGDGVRHAGREDGQGGEPILSHAAQFPLGWVHRLPRHEGVQEERDAEWHVSQGQENGASDEAECTQREACYADGGRNGSCLASRRQLL